MRSNLTSYKVARQIEFRDELPTTNVGKILRRALRDEELKSWLIRQVNLPISLRYDGVR